MKELGIKDGKWITRINDFGVDVIEEKSGFGIICFGTRMELKDAEYPEDMAESHAILCADAGNTAQKCGLLPSELLQQRDELKEKLDEAIATIKAIKAVNDAAIKNTDTK